MANEYEVNLVRQKLNNEKIKLWLSPFTQPGVERGVYPPEMILEFSNILKLSSSSVETALEQLRLHAIQKLADRNSAGGSGSNSATTSPSGVLTLNLKLVGSAAKTNIDTRLEIDFATCNTGKQLKDRILNLFENHNKSSSIKLIHKGHLITDNTLLTQCVGLKSGATLLVMLSDQSVFKKEEDNVARLKQTREDAELLSAVDGDDPFTSHYLQVANQDGRVMELPPAERKALGVALTLHEKGRSAVKSKKYDIALVFFLEADIEFKRCAFELLKSVDNYALLNLDIVWCYLSLGSISDLPDAEQRLTICEECFHRSYGVNMERLSALKGSFGQEAALFARLHLLQAILMYHQGQTNAAKCQFQKVAAELRALKVDDEKLAEVVSFGYSTAEARLALRSCYGNVENAVYQILKKRDEKTRLKRQEHEKRKKLLAQKKLGKTMNGEWVHPSFYNQLIAMGYPQEKAKQSLQMSNNNISMAIQILHDQGAAVGSIDEEKIAQLVSMGFEQNAVEEALTISGGEIEKAQEVLLSKLALDPILPPAPKKQAPLEEALRRLSESVITGDDYLDPTMAAEALDRLSEDITTGEDDDYLDLDMAEEDNFLHEYLALLE